MLAQPVYDRIGGRYREGRREVAPAVGHLLALDELDLGYRVVVAAADRRPAVSF